MNTKHSMDPLPRRSLRFRCSAFAWAVVVALGIVGDAFADRSCAHHEAAAHGVGATGSDTHHHSYPGSAGHGSEGDDRSHADPCLCLGSCQAGATLALPSIPSHRSGVPLASVQPRRILAVEEDLPGRAAFVLPYAHAPPVAA